MKNTEARMRNSFDIFGLFVRPIRKYRITVIGRKQRMKKYELNAIKSPYDYCISN
jgi:hypothetical protein